AQLAGDLVAVDLDDVVGQRTSGPGSVGVIEYDDAVEVGFGRSGQPDGQHAIQPRIAPIVGHHQVVLLAQAFGQHRAVDSAPVDRGRGTGVIAGHSPLYRRWARSRREAVSTRR